MTIPTGYKQTDVGIIPEDWDAPRLNEYVMFKTGPFGSSLHQSDYVEGGIPLVNPMQIVGGRIIPTSSMSLTKTMVKELSDFCLTDQDIVIGRRGEMGRCAVVTKREEGWLCGTGSMIIKPSGGVNSGFLQRILSSPQIIAVIESSSVGTTMINLNQSILGNLKIPLPPTLEEQEAIAEALSDADELIQLLESLIAKKRAIKQGAMQTLLTGKQRLPGFAKNKKFKNTEVGDIPEDWSVVSMGEIGQTLIGLTYSPNNVYEHGTLVLRSSNVQNNRLAYENNVFVQMALPERVMVKVNDILICVRNGSRQLIGKCALIDETAKGAAFGAFMSIYRSKYSRFLFYQFQGGIIAKQIEEVMGATINQITNKDLSSFKVILPPTIEEQEAIATTLSDMDAEIEMLEEKLEKYKQVKQGMMQELLTGRIRLVTPN